MNRSDRSGYRYDRSETPMASSRTWQLCSTSLRVAVSPREEKRDETRRDEKAPGDRQTTTERRREERESLLTAEETQELQRGGSVFKRVDMKRNESRDGRPAIHILIRTEKQHLELLSSRSESRENLRPDGDA